MIRFSSLLLLLLVCTSAALALSPDDWNSSSVPPGLERITVVFTNDVHGGIMRSSAEFLNPEFPPSLGGASAAYKIIESLRDRAKRDGQAFMIFDAGDIYQGAPIGTRTHGLAIVDYLNLIGTTAVVVGNHDLDQGTWSLDSMSKHANFTWLAANLKEKGTDKVYHAVKPWKIFELSGLKVGLIGLTTTATKYMSFPKNIAAVDIEDEIPALTRAMAEVKAAGAQSIWVIFHQGIEFDEDANYQKLLSIEKNNGFTSQSVRDAQELAHRVPGIDVMFTGHIHIGKPKGWVHPKTHTLMVQNYGHGGNIGVVDLFVDKKSGRLVKFKMPTDNSMLLLLQEEQWGRDEGIDKTIQAIVDTVEQGMDEVIGEAMAEFQRGDANSAMVEFVADAMQDYGNTDLALQNTGGVRENFAPGNITRRSIFHIEPFGNELVKFKVTGDFIKRLLENRASSDRLGTGIAGLVITFDGSRPKEDRITKIEFTNGKIFNRDSIYTVTTSDYLLMGNSGMQMLTTIPQDQVDWTGVRISDAITKFVTKKTPLQPVTNTRWIDVAEKK